MENRLLTLAPIAAFGCISSVTTVQAEEKPNIIYILADDAGWADFGCYGQKKIKTPHIDQMSKEGMTTFTGNFMNVEVNRLYAKEIGKRCV